MTTVAESSTPKLPEDLLARYDKLAESTGRTKAFYMTEALAESIDRLEYEYGILQKAEDIRAGRAKTYTPDEVRKLCGLAD